MFLWTKPPPELIDEFIAAQAKLDFSYSQVGTSAQGAPSGFVLDETRIELGSGQGAFALAAAALRDWRHFELGWVEVCWPRTPIERGRTVAVLARVLGFWTLNACRIIEVIDEQAAAGHTFGFVYGTLPDHAETGEERFTLTWNRADDSVWYTIRAFSRPNQILPRLGYPLTRRLQKRFARMSCAAMLGWCRAGPLTSR